MFGATSAGRAARFCLASNYRGNSGCCSCLAGPSNPPQQRPYSSHNSNVKFAKWDPSNEPLPAPSRKAQKGADAKSTRERRRLDSRKASHGTNGAQKDTSDSLASRLRRSTDPTKDLEQSPISATRSEEAATTSIGDSKGMPDSSAHLKPSTAKASKSDRLPHPKSSTNKPSSSKFPRERPSYKLEKLKEPRLILRNSKKLSSQKSEGGGEDEIVLHFSDVDSNATQAEWQQIKADIRESEGTLGATSQDKQRHHSKTITHDDVSRKGKAKAKGEAKKKANTKLKVEASLKEKSADGEASTLGRASTELKVETERSESVGTTASNASENTVTETEKSEASASNSEEAVNDPESPVFESNEAPLTFEDRMLRSLLREHNSTVSTSSKASAQSDGTLSDAAASSLAMSDNPFETSVFDPAMGYKHSTDPTVVSDKLLEATEPGLYSRPTLAELRKVDQDGYTRFYNSETAWDPEKDYALMPDGPERLSYMAKVLNGAPRHFISVVIDGDNLLFHPKLMRAGWSGGQHVVQELRKRLAKKHGIPLAALDLRIRMFASLNSLSIVLSKVVPRDLFFGFIQGIIDASHNNYVVNVGKASQAADERVKAALADSIRDDGCYTVYLGGLDDFGYVDELRTIKELGLLEGKVHLIRVPGWAAKSKAYASYMHKALDLDNLFSPSHEVNTWLKQQQMEAEAISKDGVNVAVGGGGETKLASSTAARPCVFHHLSVSGCKVPDCKFSHEPLAPHEVEKLRLEMKSRKCPFVARGRECHFGDHCFWRHH